VSSPTINGVTFSGANPNGVSTSGPFSWTIPWITAAYGASQHSGISSGYSDFFQSYGEGLTSGSHLTLNGLTIGTSYSLQLWSDINGVAATNAEGAYVVIASGNSVTLDSNVTDSGGGLGQYVIGTFVADATTQSFTVTSSVSSSTSGAINGFQLRTNAVPEPTTALFGIGLLGCCGVVRRRS
jgi:hypothetical protein